MKVQIIVGSVRKGSQGSKVGRWIEDVARQHDNIEVELLDLHDWSLPFYNEAMPPLALNGKYENKVGRDWSAKLHEADAYIFVTPEYNHGYSAVIKNAIDWVSNELTNKPTTILGYSMATYGGTRAVEQLKPVLLQMNAILVGYNILIGSVHEAFNNDGTIKDEAITSSLQRQLEQLVSLHTQLSHETAYASV